MGVSNTCPHHAGLFRLILNNGGPALGSKMRTVRWICPQPLTAYLSAESVTLTWRVMLAVGEGTVTNTNGGDNTGSLLLWWRTNAKGRGDAGSLLLWRRVWRVARTRWPLGRVGLVVVTRWTVRARLGR